MKKQITFAELLRVWLKRKWSFTLCLLLGVLPILYVNATMTPSYQAKSKVIFEQRQDPIINGYYSKEILRDSYIANQIEQIQTNSFLEKVVKELSAQTITTFKLPHPLPVGFDREKFLIKQIQKSIKIEPLRRTDIISITCESESPEAAMEIANTIASVLRETNLKLKRQETTEARRFIEQQLETISQQLNEAELALRDFKEKNKITSLNQESIEVLKKVSEAEKLYNQVKADRISREQRLHAVKAQLAEQRKDFVPSLTEITSPLISKLKEKLVELQAQYSILLVQNYPETHPRMIELRKEIEQTKNSLVQESIKLMASENLQEILDPISQIQKYLEESVILQIEIESLQAEEKHLESLINSYESQLQSLPEKELQLARLVRAKEVNDKIYMQLLQKREEAKITEASQIGNVRIIDFAEKPGHPVKPKKAVNLLIGFFAGLIAGLFVVYGFEYLSSNVKTPEDVENVIDGIPVIGTIPKIKRNTIEKIIGLNGNNNLVAYEHPNDPVSEAYRSLSTNISYIKSENVKSVMITSPSPKEGKTVVASNLGIVAAQSGLNTILIDADLRKPALHSLFHKDLEPGLLTLFNVCENSDFDSLYPAIEKTVQKTHIPNLSILTSGSTGPHPIGWIYSDVMGQILFPLKNHYDFVIVDAPSVLAVSDALNVAKFVEGIFFCIESGKNSEELILRALKSLEKVKHKILGIILNKVNFEDIYGTRKYYYYYSDKNQKVERELVHS